MINYFVEYYTGQLSYPNVPENIDRIRVSIVNGTNEGEKLLRKTEDLVSL